MNVWYAFTTGLRLALRYWQVLLMMLVGTLLAALPLALLPALSLLELAHRPVIAEMANGIDAWQWMDLVGSLNAVQAAAVQDQPAAISPFIQQGILGFVLILFLLPVLSGVVSAFLYGGVLLTYLESPQPFRWGRFLWGCWHWFGAFLLLAFVQALLFLLAPLPLVLTGFTLAGALGTWSLWVIVPLLVLFLLFWLALFELARLRLVASGGRNAFTGLAQSFGLLFRRPLALAGLYLLALLLLALVHLVFRFGVLDFLPLDLWPLALLAMQVYILARLFVKAVRLAGSAALVEQSFEAV